MSSYDAEFYKRNGAVVIRNFFNSTEIDLLINSIEYNLENPGLLAATASSDSDPGKFLEDFCNWQWIDGYRKLLFESKMPQIAAELMESSSVRLYHDHLLVKEPYTAQRTPWHQDQPYYNISGKQTISFWIPVDPVPIESTLELIAGSHNGEWKLSYKMKQNGFQLVL
jgi:ectoine hydroxylase-related dioxygenase (phytanoyl-CoA dioxygenase family)